MVYKNSDFKRDKSQEDSNVKYWFESKDGILISLVTKGDYNNAEVRVSGNDFDSFRIPMSDSIYEKISTQEVLNVAVKNLNRRVK